MKKRFRKGISLLLALAMMVSGAVFRPAQAAQSPEDLSQGLLAHYDFEEVVGSTVSNKVSTNTSTTAELVGGAAVTDLGGTNPLGKSMQLSTAQDGMQLRNIVNAAQSSFSVSLWYKLSGSSSVNVNLVQAGTVGGSTGRTVLILSPESTYYTYLTGDNAKVATAAVDRTQWQSITFTYDRSANKAWFYVNGVADKPEGVALSGSPLDVADMILGRHRNVEGACNGLIDEVRIYDRVLSAEEAKGIYDTTKALLETPSAPPADAITLTVDVNDPQRLIDSGSIFGINHRYAFNGYGTFDSSAMAIKEDFRKLYEQAGFGSIRYPGGTISNLFNWKTTIGPVETRKNQIHGFFNNAGQGGIAPNFGLTEIATFAEQVDSEIVYVYSLGRGNAQDAADLMEYLNAKVGTNPNGGIDWAAVRAENGHPEPYGVRYFEIGNEMQQAWNGGDGTGSQGYWLTNVSEGAESAYIDGGTAVFNRQYAVCEEDWNEQASKATGEKNLVRYMRYANVNPKMLDASGKIVDDPDFRAVNQGVSVFVGGSQWTVVDSFANSGPTDRHAVIDYATGAIHFGDGVKGQIPSAGQQITVSYSVERQGFLEVSKAIKNTIAKINELEGTDHEAHVYSSFETAGFISKMHQRRADEWYDGLTIHPYSGTPSGSGGAFYDSAMALAESAGIRKVQEYVDMMPSDKVPVISEYGIFRSTDPLVRSQTHAVYIAKVLMEYVRLGSPYIQKHCLVDWYSSGADSLGPTQQAVIQAVAGADANTVTGEGTFTFFSTPSAHVFQILNSGFGDTVVSSGFSSVPTLGNGAQALSALAAIDGSSNIYIAIVNASREEDYALKLALEGISAEGAAVTAQILTADSFSAQNSPENPNAVTVTEQTVPVEGGSISYTIPKHSFAVLKIDPAGEIDTSTAVTGFTADPAVLPTRGGETTVTVTGRNLPQGIVIKCGDAVALTSGNSIRQSALLTLPANEGQEDQVYAVQYSLDGEKFEGELSVTVAVNKYDAEDDSRDLPPSVLTATAGDEERNGGVNEGPARLVLDNNFNTLWHTDWYGTSRVNHWIQLEVSGDYLVDGLRYKPREGGSTNGTITEYQVQVSDDGVNFRTVASGNWEGNPSWKIAGFAGVQAKFVRLVAVNAMTDNAYVFASAAEIRLTGKEAAAHEHTPAEAVKENEKAATCTEKGSYDLVVYCSECNEELSRETVTVDALGHTEEVIPGKAATCTETGLTEGKKCAVCGETLVAQEEIPALGHTEEVIPGKEATCTETGLTEGKKCAVCDEILVAQEVIPALGHDWDGTSCKNCDEKRENPFVDVDEVVHKSFLNAILWASEEGITTGTDASHFNPSGTCMRGHVVTFLWRAMGEPEPTITENPFVDVDASAYYYKAVLWAYEKGITTGIDATHFNPTGKCNRAQVVTFLWRAVGKPSSTATESGFTDVTNTQEFYYDAVLWAVENQITNGMGDGTFGVLKTCNRAQVVTFLYRTFA